VLVQSVLQQTGPLKQQSQGVFDEIKGGEAPLGVQALVEQPADLGRRV
jgi:hypothetical protein